MPIIPKHIYAGTDFKTNPANNHPIGTGPFQFKEWKKGSYIHLVKNKSYHVDGQPYIDGIYWHVIPDAASRAVAIETGKVDVLVPGSIEYWDIPRLTKRDDICMTSKGREFFAPHSWMWINNRSAPMNDKRFRQAIMYAINREFVRDAVWNGMGGIPTGPISSKTRFYSDDVKQTHSFVSDSLR
jgi:peptide/nickel transport system substrate-binding protein